MKAERSKVNLQTRLIMFGADMRSADNLGKVQIFILALVNEKHNVGMGLIYRFMKQYFSRFLMMDVTKFTRQLIASGHLERLENKKYVLTVKGRAYLNDIMARWEKTAKINFD